MTDTPIDVGPLEPLLADPMVTSITVDGQAVCYTRNGLTQISEITFESDTQRRQVIAGILAACGESLSIEHPTVDCKLADGTQVHAAHAPLLLTLDKRG
jgi:pilus assembly protein CpaF